MNPLTDLLKMLTDELVGLVLNVSVEWVEHFKESLVSKQSWVSKPVDYKVKSSCNEPMTVHDSNSIEFNQYKTFITTRIQCKIITLQYTVKR